MVPITLLLWQLLVRGGSQQKDIPIPVPMAYHVLPGGGAYLCHTWPDDPPSGVVSTSPRIPLLLKLDPRVSYFVG